MASTVLALFVLSSVASAQTMEPAIDVQTFWPAAGPQHGMALRSSEIQPHLNFGFTLVGNYQYQPLVYRSERDPSTVVGAIDHSFTVDFLWAFGLFDRVQLMAALPMVAAQTGAGLRPITNGGVADEMPLVGMRDARFDVAVQILRRARRTHANGFGLRADLGLSVPSGDDRFQSSATVVLQPLLVADFRIAGFTITANAGARISFENRAWAGALFPSRLLGSLGIAYQPLVLQRLSVALDSQWLVPVVGSLATTPCQPSPTAVCAATATTQGELFAGARYAVDRGRDVEVSAGVGVPLTASPGVAAIRGLLSVAYTPRALDDDDDGVKEADDRCPTQREDRDGFEDDDGCPDIDNDNDGVLDDADRCPNVPEDRDNHEDHDGCPDTDNDGDGIDDADDQCPDESTHERPDPDRRGCPIRDRDGDEVPDADDLCPDTAVGARADPQRRGCPLPDRDRDGVGDDVDQCPSDPSGEHPDRFRRGCPDPDIDHDGIPNETDACVDQPETINGVDDADGCPDQGEPSVTLGRGAVLFANVVRLAPRTRALRPAQVALFRQAAQALRGMGAELARVTVGVVADPRDRDAREAQRLSQLVADALIAGGIDRALVEVRPVVPNARVQPSSQRRFSAGVTAGEVRITILRNAPSR
jgi:hypothetical protein